MTKRLALFLSSIALCGLLSACDPIEAFNYHTEWIIEIDPAIEDSLYMKCTIIPGQLINRYPRINYLSGDNMLSDFYELDRIYPDLDSVKLYVKDPNSEPVRIWTKAERTEPGKQFFNASYWTLENTTTDYKWIFRITEEDLIPLPETEKAVEPTEL